MLRSDNDYFAMRLRQELAAAEDATTPQAADAHTALACRYQTLLSETDPDGAVSGGIGRR